MRQAVEYPHEVKQSVCTEGKGGHIARRLRTVDIYDLRYGRDGAGYAGDKYDLIEKPQPRALGRIRVKVFLRLTLAQMDMKEHAL